MKNIVSTPVSYIYQGLRLLRTQQQDVSVTDKK